MLMQAISGTRVKVSPSCGCSPMKLIHATKQTDQQRQKGQGADMRATGTYIIECGCSVRIMNFLSYTEESLCLQK